MKIRNAFLILKTVLLSIVLISCGGGDVNPKGTTFDIYIDFWNTSGKSPEIRFDELKTSREIKIDFTKNFEGQVDGPAGTKVIIDNFRIIDEYSTTTI